MKFKDLSLFLDELEKNSSRLKITEILARLFRKSSSDEIDKVCYLVLGQLKPKYEGVVFNLAEKLVIESISLAFSFSKEEVIKSFKEKGDLGDVSFSLNKGVKAKDLSVDEVYDILLKIALDSGEGSQDRKIKNFAQVLSSVDPLSSKFITRIPLGKLRLGFSDKTILDALSWYEAGDKSKKSLLEKAYFVLPDVGLLAKKVKLEGIEKAARGVSPLVGVPVLPMLAQRLKDPKEMIEKMGQVAIEPKIDGLRLQIHYKKGEDGFVKAYTRNLNEVSWMFPELSVIKEITKSSFLILDAEAVGVDEERKRMADFQTTMTRRRKHEIDSYKSSVPIQFFVFDIILESDNNLMNKPYLERKEILRKSLKENSVFRLVGFELTDSPLVIERKYREFVGQGFEGVLVKKSDSHYVSGRTGWRWVKMKEEKKSVGKLADTIDCVVMGYYVGKGKRAKFGLGGLLVGVLQGDRILTITKIGTGLSDEQFRLMHQILDKVKTVEKPKEYGSVDKTLIPDFWVLPSVVIEVAADEITKSPVHSCGFALRFPRLVRLREDKSFSDATTLSEVKRLYKIS